MRRRRLDLELVARGLAATEERARDLIAGRQVTVGGSLDVRPSTLVAPSDDIRLASPPRFVSRGGDKLDAALGDLGVDVKGRRCLDGGAGSGGFTHCLLLRGAAEVVAVDVGYGQFDWSLRDAGAEVVAGGRHQVRRHALKKENIRKEADQLQEGGGHECREDADYDGEAGYRQDSRRGREIAEVARRLRLHGSQYIKCTWRTGPDAGGTG